MNLSIELKTRIYNHIGKIQQHLDAFEADEQREIVESIETHIHDALEARTAGEPTMALLDAIIAEMDPPESYGSAPLIAPSNSTSLSSGRKIFFFSSIATLCILFIAIWLSDPFSSHWMSEAAPEESAASSRAIPPGGGLKKSTAVKPSPLVGKWTAIDLVSSINEFNPSQTKWTGELELKGLQFFTDGTTDKPWWTWKDDRLFHSGDQSEAEFSIKTFGDVGYLFLEWMSGDVLEKGLPPKYYVLKRGEYSEETLGNQIVAGVGCGAFKVGASREDLIETLGMPDPGSTDRWLQWKKKHHIHCLIDSSRDAFELRFDRGFNGKTAESIGFGSTEKEAVAAYGQPNDILDKGSAKKLEWSNQGILMWISDQGVTQTVIFKPY
ncbi:hypothetical protein [Pontiella sulfatireligans]|uniref:Uncharacterized protein n=1 Tax=Pontiella sulfatireligans TaxID=2750658 RepID=A0A6C2UPX9_9BACT|nr:hypothetical protein [Pontiella sulfatireligans]VGO21331.1 hypothetical protein SCARR_03403 [Pontiella sulfatireligans]